jgi:hypothetical protein
MTAPTESRPMLLYTLTDEDGSSPVLLDEPPKESTRLRWQLVAEVDSVEEADAIIDALGLDRVTVKA